MKAMLLAAGRGERLLPLTLTVPKPTIPVLGRPIAVQILRRLADHGVRDVVVNLHHEPETIRALLRDGRDVGLESLHYSLEERLLGTGGGIGRAAPLLRGAGPVLVHNADFLSDIDLARLGEVHAASGKPVTLAVAPHRPGFTPVEVDAEGRVVSIGRAKADRDRPTRTFLFTGCHLLEEGLLEAIPPGPVDIVRGLYMDLVEQERVGAFVHEGFWWEFGSPEAYLEGSLKLLGLPADRLARVAGTDPVCDLGAARVAVGPGADFHQGVSLLGSVALGFASRISEGSVLEDTVIMPESWVGPGSRLERVVVAPGAELPAGIELDRVLVCTDVDPSYDPPAVVKRRKGLLIRPLAGEPRA